MKAVYLTVKPFENMIIIACNIHALVNDHASLELRGIINEDEAIFINKTKGEMNITVTAVNDSGDKEDIFQGLAQSITLEKEGDQYQIALKAIAFSSLMDETKHLRVFQEKDTTYKEMVNYLFSLYKGSDFLYMGEKNKRIDELLIQYQETDWELLKRLASWQNTVLVPVMVNESVRVYWGLPQAGTANDIKVISYSQVFNGKFAEVIAETREIYKLCEAVLFQGQQWVIYKIDSAIKGGELIQSCYLCHKESLKMARFENDKIIGLSVSGQVEDIKGTMVRVSIKSENSKLNNAKKWFSFASVYASVSDAGWYCMPEKGDAVRIYFPDNVAESAYAVSAYYQSGDNQLRTNPDHKSFRTIYNKEILMTPDRILLTNHDGTSIELSDKKGIKLKSDKAVSIHSEDNISLKSSKGIKVKADDGIMMVQDRNSIVVRNGIRQSGLTVRYK